MAANEGMQARFRYGNVPVTSPYTPSGADVDPGDVVVIEDLVGIATQAILDGELGALNMLGGVYECIGDAAIAAGKRVHWDDTNKKVTETALNNNIFGYTVSACAADEGTCDVMHIPGGTDLLS